MNQESRITNNEEFYHKDIFGTTVDISLGEEEESSVGSKAKVDFNIFTLTDAFGARKKREAWVLYRQALSKGVSSEEVFWKLVWQVKTLLLADRTKNAEEADMKVFPYNKAKSFLKHWKKGELENLSENLVVGYHQTRLGKEEMETFIEKTILNL